jgi:hypothetical protein
MSQGGGTLSPGVNFVPRGELCPLKRVKLAPGVKLSPRGKVGP